MYQYNNNNKLRSFVRSLLLRSLLLEAGEIYSSNIIVDGCMGRQRNSQMKERAILLLGWRCLAQNNNNNYNNADGAVVW
jgi:hypothetical protein